MFVIREAKKSYHKEFFKNIYSFIAVAVGNLIKS